MSSIGTMHTTARNRSGRCVIAAPTSRPEFEPPKMASFCGSVRPVSISHSAAHKKVVECHLPVPPLGGVVPLDAEFRSSTNVGQRKQAPALDAGKPQRR